MARKRAKGAELEGAAVAETAAALDLGNGWTRGTKLCDNPDCDDPNCGQTFWVALPFERRSWAWWFVWTVGTRGVPAPPPRSSAHTAPLLRHSRRHNSSGWWTWVPLILVGIGAFWRAVFAIYTPYIEELIGI